VVATITTLVLPPWFSPWFSPYFSGWPYSVMEGRSDMEKLEKLINKAHSRRSFLAGVGIVGATATFTACGGSTPQPSPTPHPNSWNY
jgi:hypothetical protein